MTASRRAFLRGAAASAIAWPYALRAQDAGLSARLFQQIQISGVINVIADRAFRISNAVRVPKHFRHAANFKMGEMECRV